MSLLIAAFEFQNHHDAGVLFVAKFVVAHCSIDSDSQQLAAVNDLVVNFVDLEQNDH